MTTLAIVLALALVVGAAALALYRLGVRRERDRREAERGDEYAETRRRMDAVDAGDDPAVLRDWLRERGRQSGGDL